jgi:hypothetical protein
MTLVKKTWLSELESAEQARLAGNEGQARVCARRAAGISARDFLSRRQVRTRGGNLYNALLDLAQYPRLTPDLKTAASHLTLRVGDDFSLPPGVDLLADARLLCEHLEEIP